MERPAKRLTLKKLECELQQLDDFEEPKIDLEQYATPPHIAAAILVNIASHNDLEGKFVADLGCGCGRLSVGSVLCGAAMVVGFDVDEEALGVAVENSRAMFNDDDDDFGALERLNFVQLDITCDKMWRPMRRKFDTVLMNPPFGTKQNKGVDMVFLERAIELSSNAVYSLHKTSTRNHILKRCQEWRVTGKPVAQVRYNLESSYKFHKKATVDIDVDLWRIEVASGAN